MDLVGGDRGTYDVRVKLTGQPQPFTIGFVGHGTGGVFRRYYTVDGDSYDTGELSLISNGDREMLKRLTHEDYKYPFADEIFESMHDGGAAVTFSFPFRHGRVVLTFPLEGLADTLDAAGFDTRRYTQYESTRNNDQISASLAGVMKTVFWLHESDFDEYVRRMSSGGKFKHTYEVRRQPAEPKLALMAAALRGDAANAKAPLDAGVNADAKDNDGDTPLITAAMKGHTGMANALLDAGADVDATNNAGDTALLAAAANGHAATAKALLDAGADTDPMDEQGFTPLIAAARNGHTGIAKALLDAGADVDASNNAGITALMAAAANGHAATAKALLDAGADVHASPSGYTALKVAERRGHAETAKVLRDAGAD